MARRSDDEWLDLLASAARTGEPLALVPDGATGALKDPAEADTWDEDRQLPAGVLRQAVLAMTATDVDPDPRGLTVIGADIVDGPLDLSFASLPVPLALTSCRLRHGADLMQFSAPVVVFNSSYFDPEPNPDTPALHLNGARIDGGLFLNDAHVGAALWAMGVHLGGDLAAQRATLIHPAAADNPAAVALNIQGARIDGSVFLHGARVTGVTSAVGIDVGGTFEANSAGLGSPAATAAPQAMALNLQGARINRGLFLRHADAVGAVWAIGAAIGGQVSAIGARLTNPAATTNAEAHALNLQDAQLPLVLLDGLQANGVVGLRGAKVRDLWAKGARLVNPAAATNPEAAALILDSARIQGGAYLHRVQASGVVRARGAHIGAQLHVTDSTLTQPAAPDNPDAEALSLTRARVDDGVYLGGTRASGGVSAAGAVIGGQLAVNGATLTQPAAPDNPDAYALSLHGARIDDGLILQPERIDGIVDLTNATIGSLVMGREQSSKTSVQAAPLAATGWTVGDLHGWVRTNRREAARWLDNRPRDAAYTPQPWHELAVVYERNGHPAEAKRLRTGAAWRTTKAAPWTVKPGRLLYGALVGYGYYPLLAAGWLLAALLAAWAVVSTNADTFVMTGSDITPYPPLEPLAYALETVIPAVAVLAESPWAPPLGGGTYYTLTALSISGWVLSVLFLAGISGILRKT